VTGAHASAHWLDATKVFVPTTLAPA